MRALVQRVSKSQVKIGLETVGSITAGLCIFIGIMEGDDFKDIKYLVDKTINLRIFPNSAGKFDRSALDLNAELMVISQFTLYADTSKGRMPSFIRSARPEKAKEMFEDVVKTFTETGLQIQTGKFQKHMHVSLVNDGPVTIFIDSKHPEI